MLRNQKEKAVSINYYPYNFSFSDKLYNHMSVLSEVIISAFTKQLPDIHVHWMVNQMLKDFGAHFYLESLTAVGL